MGERRRLRSRIQRVDPRRGPRDADGPQAPVRLCLAEHAHPADTGDAPRGLQAVRARQRHERLLARGLHEHQARAGVPRLSGDGDDELMRLDTEQALGSRVGVLRRFPLGPVLGITPFNFPLNLVAHKVAPALGVGAPITVKPASATPIGSLRLAEFFDETDLPKGMYQVLPVSSKVADGMARDERYRKISFTGSSEIGWYLKGLDPKKRVTLELGGNAGVIVHSDADLDFAAQRIAFGGYYQAGQSCISVQRVYVASDVYDRFAELLTKQVQQLKVGDPLDPTVDVGPVIQRSEVERIGGWVEEAVH